MRIPKPCLTCGEPTEGESRCRDCESERNARRNAKRTHYHGDYKQRAALVRATATQCWICGKGHKPDDPWQADHLEPGNPESALAPAHRSCNARRGNAKPR